MRVRAARKWVRLSAGVREDAADVDRGIAE
jgi:hypothetical protein